MVTYSYNIINWNLQDIKRMDTKTRKLLTAMRMHHPKADVHRLYVPRSEGGRGLVQLEAAYKTATIGLDSYLHHTQDKLLKPILKHENDKRLHSITKEATKFRQYLNMEQRRPTEHHHQSAAQGARAVKITAKNLQKEELNREWKSKPLHGRFPTRLSNGDIDQQCSLAWLRSAGLKAETEGLLVAAQDQSLNTRAYRHRIVKDSPSPLCRICNKFEETVDHVISGCPELAKTDYMERHNRIAKYLHWLICRSHGLKVPNKWYEHQPDTVTEKDNITILWDMPVITDRQIAANRPDIIVKNKSDRTCHLIDVAVPADKNTSVKTVEKLSKYKDLEIEVSRMWKLRANTIPVIIGALGLIPKSSDLYLGALPCRVSKYELQKIGLLGTAHILRRVLSIK